MRGPVSKRWIVMALPFAVYFRRLSMSRQRMGDNLAHDARQSLAGKRGERNPARAGWRRRARWNVGCVNGELQRKVREHVAHHAGDLTPGYGLLHFRRRKTRRAGARFGFVEI